MDSRQNHQDQEQTIAAEELDSVNLPQLDPVTLVARANLYLQLARALAYPTNELMDSLRSGDFLQEVRETVAILDQSEALETAVNGLAASLEQLGSSHLQLREEHTYLFARQVQASPYGTSYGNNLAFAQMRDREELAGYYAAFGFQIADDRRELHDHVSVELEFVGVLCAKEAYAADTGQTEAAAICREARARVLGKHIANWLPKFVDRLKSTARIDFYPAVGEVAVALVQDEPIITQLNVPGTYGNPWATDAEEDEFSCGAVGEHCLSALE